MEEGTAMIAGMTGTTGNAGNNYNTIVKTPQGVLTIDVNGNR